MKRMVGIPILCICVTTGTMSNFNIDINANHVTSGPLHIRHFKFFLKKMISIILWQNNCTKKLRETFKRNRKIEFTKYQETAKLR